jgi:hypothetical protein
MKHSVAWVVILATALAVAPLAQAHAEGWHVGARAMAVAGMEVLLRAR